MQQILVTGGAGYIGSQTVKLLKQAKKEIVILDDLSNGHPEAIPDVPLEIVDLRNYPAIEKVFTKYHFSQVIHFASVIEAGESVIDPAKYIDINLIGSANLFKAMLAADVKQLVFSSTAAVYGTPEHVPITEDDPTHPDNPYGLSKLQVEEILRTYDLAYGLKSVCLRYFNAAGADPDGAMGDDHNHKTHLISVALAHALGQLPEMKIFGTDYDTPDGTAIRDYIHVDDLARAHLFALDFLEREERSDVFNLGTAQGYSVREVLKKIEEVTGKHLTVREVERRAGDPTLLVAANAKAREHLGWTPQYTDLSDTIKTAWDWLQAHPNGYKS